MEFIKQGTPEWEEARLRRFTSSEIHKLMASPESDRLPVGAMSYANEVLDEIITGNAKTFSNKYVEYGKTMEEQARLAIEQHYGKDTLICGFIVHPDMPYYGGSLDSVIIVDGVKYAIEIKCPFYPVEHRKNVTYSSDNALFKSKAPDYYWQCQSNIVIGQCDKMLFASFCPYLKQPLHISVIERNDKDIELMLKRLQRAWEYIENEAEAFEVELPYTINNRSSLLCSGDSINGQSIVVVEEK